ncbi:MAG: hypothetical protein ACFB8W_00995, partial [Elainellaceae cyanobacterium]
PPQAVCLMSTMRPTADSEQVQIGDQYVQPITHKVLPQPRFRLGTPYFVVKVQFGIDALPYLFPKQ